MARNGRDLTVDVQQFIWEYIKFASGPLGATTMVKATGYFPANTLPTNDPKVLAPFYKATPTT